MNISDPKKTFNPLPEATDEVLRAVLEVCKKAPANADVFTTNLRVEAQDEHKSVTAQKMTAVIYRVVSDVDDTSPLLVSELMSAIEQALQSSFATTEAA